MAQTRTFDLATALATFAQKKLAFAPRGSLLIHCVGDGSKLVGIFGNDNYLADRRARREVELVRRRLASEQVKELGFGLSHDGQSWALLFQADAPAARTPAGRAFQLVS